MQRFGAFILGFLCGWDRIRFRATKRQLCYTNGIMGFLQQRNVRYADFKSYSQEVTESVFQAIEPSAKEAGIFRYLNSKLISPEETALQIAAEHKKTEGLIAVLGRVEPCQTIAWEKSKNGWWMPRLKSGAKCLHYYHYYLDPQFGLRYTRLQTWFPFTMYIGINGRDWLARQMTDAGIQFTQKENCLTWIDNFQAAQTLLDDQHKTDWPRLLQSWTELSNPIENSFLDKPVPYYWTMQEAEFATDIVFRSPEELQQWYPMWVHQAYAILQSANLLKYMNYRVCKNGRPHPNLSGEVKTSIKAYLDGTRVRHQIQGNLLKMYDKMGSVLRVESMLHDIYHFRVFRTSEGTQGEKRYMRLRKGVADMHRRAEISHKINDRYIETLAVVEEPKPLGEIVKDLGKRVRWKGRSVRAINPLSVEDIRLMQAVNRGEFLIQGFRNQDIRKLLFGDDPDTDQAETKSRSLKVTRFMRLLRAHGLIAKIPKTHRYQISAKGRTTINALAAARQANVKQLLQAG